MITSLWHVLPTRQARAAARPGAGTHRIRRGLVLSVTASAVTGLALSGALESPAVGAPTTTAVLVAAIPTTDTFVPVAGPVFGDPTAAHNEILTRLLQNIAHTPRGATIHIVGYSFSLGNVATALLNAHARGVNVQVVVNGHSREWSPAKRMVPILGTDTTKGSFFVLTRGSARGTGGVLHQKSWSFSQVGRTPDVVMVGSTNLTGHGTAVQYSDNYVYTKRADVYGVFRDLFAVQKLDQPVVSPFVSKAFVRGTADFFPKPGATATTDPVLLRINALPGNKDTTIRVSQYAWYGPRGVWLAHALAAKKRAGATVVVIAGESVGSNVRSALTGAKIPIHSGLYAEGKRIHTKLMMASYTNSTGRHSSIWTGSDNWADESLRNDDSMVRVDDDAAGYAKYVSFFNLLVNPAAAPTPVTPPEPTPVTPPKPTPVVQRTTSITTSLSRTRVARLHRAVLSGTVRPVYAGRTVLVQRHWYRASTWRTVARSAPLKTSASYHVRAPTGRPGLFRYRTVVRATTTAKAAHSRTVSLRVTR